MKATEIEIENCDVLLCETLRQLSLEFAKSFPASASATELA